MAVPWLVLEPVLGKAAGLVGAGESVNHAGQVEHAGNILAALLGVSVDLLQRLKMWHTWFVVAKADVACW